MRTARRLSVVLVVVFAGIGLLSSVPATAERDGRPEVRMGSRAIVHGRVTRASIDLPTSFEVFGQRSRPASSTEPPAAVSAPRVPVSLSGFDGLADLDGFFPSDTVGALGDGFIVGAVNSSVQVFDRNGVTTLARTPFTTLSGNPSLLQFDPKVVYDDYANTFVLVWLGQEDSPRTSRIFVAAIPNATAPDITTWCITEFAGDQIPGSPNVWADYPGLGFNDSRVTITTNQFTFPSSTGRFKYSQIMTFDKADLYDCSQPAPSPTVFGGTKTRDANGFQSFTIQPAQTVGSSPGAQVLISFELINGRLDYLVLWRIKPTATGFTLKKACCGPTGKVSLPPPGTQGGGGLNSQDLWWDAGDFRLINAFYDADRNELFAAHVVFKNFKPDVLTGGYPEAAVQWYEVNPASKLGNSVLARKGVIGSTEVDVGWPTVATDAEGTLFVTYNRASDPHNEFLSAWVATIPAGSNIDTQLLLHAGSATYDVVNGVERWGDYTAVNRDPLSSGQIATFNQYASSSSTWQQFISLVTDN